MRDGLGVSFVLGGRTGYSTLGCSPVSVCRKAVMAFTSLSSSSVPSCQRNVAQRAGTEHVLIGCSLSDIEAAAVAFRQDVRAGALHQTEGVVVLAAEIDAGVAGHAALVDEQLQTGKFLTVQRVLA